MSDPNGPRHEEHDDRAEQPVEGFSVTDEQHAAPSAPAAPSTPGVGEPAQSFSSPAVDPAPQAPGQPAFSEPARSEPADDVSQGWQHGQQQRPAAQQDAYGQSGSSPYGAAPSAPQHAQFGQQPGQQPHGDQQFGQQPGQPQYGQGQPAYGAPGQSQHNAPGQPQYGAPGQPQYGAPSQPQYAASAPMSPVDEKNAGMWGHLSGLSTIVTGGWGGWIGPLIVFLIYKDRSAFARQESKEALNFGIFMTILTLGIILVSIVLGVITLGLASFLGLFWWIPALLQVIFSIIGGVRVNNGGSYRYPFNWRLVK